MLTRAVQFKSSSLRQPPRLQVSDIQRKTRTIFIVHCTRKDVLLRSLSDMAEVAVLVVDGTNLVAEAARRHGTAPTATAALGRVLLGTLLMASFGKEEEEATQVTFRGDGPIGSIMAVADTKGNVRGKVGNPLADPPLRDGKIDVGAAVGAGMVAVVRSHPLDPHPHTGMTSIVSGEVAEDLTQYLAESEQTNSALGLGVSVDREATVRHAGGFLVQVLPLCSEETLVALESNLAAMPPVTQMLGQGMTPQDITQTILAGVGVAPGATTLTPVYGPCDRQALKQRMIDAVASLGEEEVRSIAQEQGKIEVTCDFCNETLVLPESEVLAAITQDD